MKKLLFIALLVGCLSPCMAQNDRIELQEPLEETVIYKKTTTFKLEGCTYQCDVDDGSQLVTLYNKENVLTYADIVYKATGKPFVGSWSSSTVEYDSIMSRKEDFIVDYAFTKCMADEIEDCGIGNERKFTITMLLNPDTGKVMEVNFMFFTFEPYARVPLHVYREIETGLKKQIQYKPTKVGKQLNYIMLSWRQKPKGKLPQISPVERPTP